MRASTATPADANVGVLFEFFCARPAEAQAQRQLAEAPELAGCFGSREQRCSWLCRIHRKRRCTILSLLRRAPLRSCAAVEPVGIESCTGCGVSSRAPGCICFPFRGGVGPPWVFADCTLVFFVYFRRVIPGTFEAIPSVEPQAGFLFVSFFSLPATHNSVFL